MKLFEEKYGTIEYDASVPCIIVTTFGYMTSDQFRNFLDIALYFIIPKKKNNQRLCWIADTRKRVVRPDEDTCWVVENWNSRAMAAGIYHIAFVSPQNIFGDLSVKKYISETEKQGDRIVLQLFGDLHAAKDWCKSLIR
jgi:hypothetical protein